MHLTINVASCILLFSARCCVTSPISDSKPLFENLRNEGKLLWLNSKIVVRDFVYDFALCVKWFSNVL